MKKFLEIISDVGLFFIPLVKQPKRESITVGEALGEQAQQEF